MNRIILSLFVVMLVSIVSCEEMRPYDFRVIAVKTSSDNYTEVDEEIADRLLLEIDKAIESGWELYKVDSKRVGGGQMQIVGNKEFVESYQIFELRKLKEK